MTGIYQLIRRGRDDYPTFHDRAKQSYCLVGKACLVRSLCLSPHSRCHLTPISATLIRYQYIYSGGEIQYIRDTSLSLSATHRAQQCDARKQDRR